MVIKGDSKVGKNRHYINSIFNFALVFLISIIVILACKSVIGQLQEKLTFNAVYPVVGSGYASPSPYPSPSPSPCIKYDNVRMNISDGQINVGQVLLWNRSLVGDYDEFGSIVSEGNVIYFARKNFTNSMDPRNQDIYALNALNGNIIWHTNIGSSDGTPLLDSYGPYIYINTFALSNFRYYNPFNPIHNSFNYFPGVFKINKINGAILAYNGTCGLGPFSQAYDEFEKWVGSVDSITQNKNLIFELCTNGYIYAYNKKDLTVNWSYFNNYRGGVGGVNVMTPFIYGDRLFDARGGFLVLNATTGEKIHKGDFYFATWDVQPSVNNNILYFGDQAGFEFAVNLTDYSYVQFDPIKGDIKTQSAIFEGKVWFGDQVRTGSRGYNAKLFALNLSTGEVICNITTEGRNVYQGPSIVKTKNNESFVMIGVTSGINKGPKFFVYNASNCSLIYKYNFNEGIFNQPAISRGKVFLKNDDKNVYAFDFGKGNGDWKYMGYDATGRSFCPDCLTEWMRVEKKCKTENGILKCKIENRYDRCVKVSLYSDILTDWTVDYSNLPFDGKNKKEVYLYFNPYSSSNLGVKI